MCDEKKVLGSLGAYYVEPESSEYELECRQMEGQDQDRFADCVFRIEETKATRIDVAGENDPLHVVVTGEELMHLAQWVMERCFDEAIG